MKLISLTKEELNRLDGARPLLETEISVLQIMTSDVNDMKGLVRRHYQELEQEIRDNSLLGADAYLIGAPREGKITPFGCSAFSSTFTYPITYFKLPSYYYRMNCK